MTKSHQHIIKPKILVIEDQPEQMGALFTALQKTGYSLLIAKRSAEALDLLTRMMPDIILLDVDLPDITGFELCRRLKQDETVQEIPVLFITASTGLVDKLEGFQAGGADYITKPFHIEEVLARVKTHLTIRRLQRELQEENSRYQGLSEATFEGIILHEQGQIIEVNRILERLLGYSRHELIGRNAFEMFLPACHLITTVQFSEEPIHACDSLATCKDGRQFPVAIRCRQTRYQGQQVIVTALRDITWRKSLEQQKQELESENITLRASLSERQQLGELVGHGPAMQKVYERLLKAALSDAPVIIYGETGTGKELAARTLWTLSEHHTKTFISVNCAAIQENLFESQFFGYRKGAFTGANADSPGYFKQAAGGVLFLDEIGELPLDMQAKLLRVLNNGEYTPVGATQPEMADVRIIAATNQPLRTLIATGQFREDLFHRLHVISIAMPPLRQHKDDLPLLISHVLHHAHPDDDGHHTLPKEILAQFEEYDWPGNVRELANALRQYITMGEVDLDSTRDIPPSQPDSEIAAGTFTEQVEALERKLLANALERTNGNRTNTAELLNIPKASLYRKIQKYGL